MKSFLVMILSICSIAACSSSGDQNEQETPLCIKTKIEKFKSIAACDKSTVKEYVFQGKTVFAFDDEACCCDFTTEVVDTDCKSLGFLGGFAGFTKINGEDFYTNAKLIRVIWKR